MVRKEIVFVFNLLQDVNIQRGLVYLAQRETDAHIHFLVTAGFLKRDSQQTWRKELIKVAQDTNGEVHVLQDDGDAQQALRGRGGIVISASESDLGPHRETAAVLQSAPQSFVTITLQHGLECVGFRQSKEHVISHGRDVGFNADIICTWFEASQLTATRVSERSKVVVTGPSTLIQRPRQHPDHPPISGGMVCENMHSVRMRATGDHKASFMDIFFDFCERMKMQSKKVTLRPHPGGQYVLKNNIALPSNIILNNLPIYDVNLTKYQYGISAPSTVVFDMVLAGMPVGVWSDGNGIMDLGNYKGLTEISSVKEWLSFEKQSRQDPSEILDRQHKFLNDLSMPTAPTEIYTRFRELFCNILSGLNSGQHRPKITSEDPMPAGPKRILFIANDVIATLQLSFLKPLAEDFNSGNIKHKTITEKELTERFSDPSSEEAGNWLRKSIKTFNPDLILCCRYSGPHVDQIFSAVKKLKTPIVFHIDDDLLTIPKVLGLSKWRSHNHPKRLKTVRKLLDHSNLVYASTNLLQKRLGHLQAKAPIIHGEIYCSAQPLRNVTRSPVKRVGYMGTSSHAHDLEFVLPAIADYLTDNPQITFEIFGLSSVPPALTHFGSRIQIVPSVADYKDFLKTLADRQWDIGLCPLAHMPFNAVKANTKWIEYTACGMATIATKGLVYDTCAAEGRGLLVTRSEWREALQTLTDDPELRYRMALQAQTHLLLNYSDTRLREQVLKVFAHAMSLEAADQSDGQLSTEEISALLEV